MIPDIGLMIGAYVVTRMISFLTRNGERAESMVVKVLAAITVLITLICVADLLMRGQPTPP
jgi:hypothetical protein